MSGLPFETKIFKGGNSTRAHVARSTSAAAQLVSTLRNRPISDAQLASIAKRVNADAVLTSEIQAALAKASAVLEGPTTSFAELMWTHVAPALRAAAEKALDWVVADLKLNTTPALHWFSEETPAESAYAAKQEAEWERFVDHTNMRGKRHRGADEIWVKATRMSEFDVVEVVLHETRHIWQEWMDSSPDEGDASSYAISNAHYVRL